MKDGFLLINKEIDYTSRDVCNKLCRILNVPKIGHAGTLDPFATGLLIVAIGNATKVLSIFENLSKTYVATLKLGIKTDTGDLKGKIIETKPIKQIDLKTLNKTFSSFIGEIKQIPPMTSAVHVNGRKLYSYAHNGEEIERKPRDVKINYIELLYFKEDEISFICNVEKGTYIRTLGEDIAQNLDTVGHLISLNRVEISNFNVSNSHLIDEVKPEHIIPIYDFMKDYIHCLTLKGDDLLKAIHGGKLSFKICKEKLSTFLVIDEDKNAIAIYENNINGYYECKRGLR